MLLPEVRVAGCFTKARAPMKRSAKTKLNDLEFVVTALEQLIFRRRYRMHMDVGHEPAEKTSTGTPTRPGR